MRRIWIAVLALGLATAVVLAYTWRNIPVLNTWLTNSGVISTIQEGISGVTNGITNLSPQTFITAIITSVGSLSLIIRNQIAKRKEDQITLSNVRVMAQEKEGMLKATFEDAKELLTGNISELKEEYASLEGELSAAKTVIDGKDDKIIEVQGELSSVQQDLIETQGELKETIKQMDEYRIALKEKEKPTLH